MNNSCKISFFGYTISKEGISPDQALIKNAKNSYTYKWKKNLILGGISIFLQAICTKIYELDWAVCKFKKKECLIYLVRETTKSFW